MLSISRKDILKQERIAISAEGDLVVMKFGGTAVESGERIRHISNLALNFQQNMGFDVILVTSAVKGMTDEILAVAESVKKGDKAAVNQFVDRLKRLHLSLIDSSIFDEAKKTKEPVFVMRNNKPEIAIIDAKKLEEMEAILAVLESREEARAGKAKVLKSFKDLR